MIEHKCFNYYRLWSLADSSLWIYYYNVSDYKAYLTVPNGMVNTLRLSLGLELGSVHMGDTCDLSYDRLRVRNV